MTKDKVIEILENQKFTPFVKARRLRKYMKENDLNIRKVMKQYKIPQDVLIKVMFFEKFTEGEYTIMKNKLGWTDKDIEDTVRNKYVYTEKYFQIQLQSCIQHMRNVRSHARSNKLSENTINMTKELLDGLNYILFTNDRWAK